MVRRIKFLVMDVDGTLTDGKIYVGETGELFKAFDIKDGCGIKEILPRYGIIPIIITARTSSMLEKRCKELGITELHQGCRDKLKKLNEIVKTYSGEVGYGLKDVAYVGDDFLDIECMVSVQEAGGFAACPFDAIKEIKEIADFVSVYKCGEGAIREFIEWYVAKVEGNGLEKVKEVSIEAYDFIRDFIPNKTPDGRYELNKGVYANVMSYVTKPLQLSMYEAHQKYIDVQYIVYGEELLATVDAKDIKGMITEQYNSNKDVTLFDYNGGNVRVLRAGDVAVLYPDDAHRGAIAVGRPVKIRKIVVKVPYKKEI